MRAVGGHILRKPVIMKTKTAISAGLISGMVGIGLRKLLPVLSHITHHAGSIALMAIFLGLLVWGFLRVVQG